MTENRYPYTTPDRIKHDGYTLYCLKNLVSMFKEHEDSKVRLYAVALNVLSLLCDGHYITDYEFHVLSDFFAHFRKVDRDKPHLVF